MTKTGATHNPIDSSDIDRRARWIRDIWANAKSFDERASDVETSLKQEVEGEGNRALLSHLRLCGAVPEEYSNDSSEEKLYARYTDALVSSSFSQIGLSSFIIPEGGDAADVYAEGDGLSLVADAKAFRLSRTAKNQKDFKIEALSTWRDEAKYAVLVCPIYQVPQQRSQIYRQAIANNVCILSFTHLAVMVGFANRRGPDQARNVLRRSLDAVSMLQLGKSAADYWMGVNGELVRGMTQDGDLWTLEKKAAIAGLDVVRREAILALRKEKQRLLRLSHEDAVAELVKRTGIERRIGAIESLPFGSLLD